MQNKTSRKPPMPSMKQSYDGKTLSGIDATKAKEEPQRRYKHRVISKAPGEA